MLSILTIILIVADLIALVLGMIRLFSKWLKWYITVLLLISILHLIIDGFYQTLIPLYIVTLALIAIGLYRWRKTEKESKKPLFFRLWAVLWRLVCVLCLTVAIFATWYFGKSNSFITTLFSPNSHESDFTGLGWSKAFDEMSSLLQRDYAFGEWKKIDWKYLYEEYAGRIADAEKSGDEVAYYRALREYVLSLPDGHVSIQGKDYGLQKATIGGGFGISAIQLDDARVIVSVLEDGCPAKAAGMEWGAEIIQWNALPVLAAIDQVPLKWMKSTSCATTESRDITKTLYLSRAPIGTSVPIIFRNPDESAVREITLTAYDDSYSSLLEARFMGLPLPEEYVEWSIRPDGYAYLKISGEIPALSLINPVGEVCKAVNAFVAADVPGVILDLRINYGGIDDMAPLMMSFFTDESMFYEQQAYRNKRTGEFEVIEETVLFPSKPCYSGPLVMLISHNTASTGEGFPFIMESLGLGPVLGFYGTNGSFGMAEGNILMPGGYLVNYPNGAALDQDGNIMIDSDYTLQGGVQPDVQVPLDMETIKAIFVDKRDVLLDEAIALMEKTI